MTLDVYSQNGIQQVTLECFKWMRLRLSSCQSNGGLPIYNLVPIEHIRWQNDSQTTSNS